MTEKTITLTNSEISYLNGILNGNICSLICKIEFCQENCTPINITNLKVLSDELAINTSMKKKLKE